MWPRRNAQCTERMTASSRKSSLLLRRSVTTTHFMFVVALACSIGVSTWSTWWTSSILLTHHGLPDAMVWPEGSTQSVHDSVVQAHAMLSERALSDGAHVPRSDQPDDANDAHHAPLDDAMDEGILSRQDDSFFRRLQADIDDANPVERCARYGWTTRHAAPRRLFYGALIASEPLELWHIVAAETYGIYSGMVFVEGNRTQNFAPRPFLHRQRAPTFARLFGLDASRVHVRPFVNEFRKLTLLAREQRQRAAIIHGWRALGMQPDDVGVLTDADETLSRDVLRALQTCDVPHFNYTRHSCRHDLVKLTGHTRIYEGSPLCVPALRAWFHPDAIVGHCIDGIARDTRHEAAPRESWSSFLRAPGFGHHCSDWEGEANITRVALERNVTPRYPLWNAADFRRTCSGPQTVVVPSTNATGARLDPYTGYHFHNFFAHLNQTRFKYETYGHADRTAPHKSIGNVSHDLQMMVRCVLDEADPVDSKWQRLVGDTIRRPFEPVYFADADYRRRRHAHVRAMVQADDAVPRPASKPRRGRHGRPTDGPPITRDDAHDNSTPRTRDDAHDSSTATVIALATNYELKTYQRFVGSLRRTGYTGHVIVGLQPRPPRDVVDYLMRHNVTMRVLSWVNCTYARSANETIDIFQKTTCASPYPDIKIRWSRFPLARDWLTACTTCTGPVLLTDARDVVFQRDPFGPGSPHVEGLHVFQEDAAMTTANWLTEWPIRECKNVTYQQPMLCSGTTIGTRAAMLEYLTTMYQEMKVWIEDPKCRFNINGDDQSIHNYLFYSGRLPFATSIPNRQGGIVNTIGHFAGQLFKQHIRPLVNDKSVTGRIRYPGATKLTWIGVEHNITNSDGLLIEFDGTVSRVVHQWDRFGFPFYQWLDQQPWISDT